MGGSGTCWLPRQLQWTIDCSKSSPTLTGHQCSLGVWIYRDKVSHQHGHWKAGQWANHAALNPAKLFLIDSLVQQKFGLGNVEFAALQSGIRAVFANRCKFLHLQLGPEDSSVIQDQNSLSSISFVLWVLSITYVFFFCICFRSNMSFSIQDLS